VKKKKVEIAGLEFGMYVAELDRPWTETPFMFQGFVLRSEEELTMLRKHCQYVYVDDDRQEAPDDPARVASAPKGAAPPLPGTRRVAHVERRAVDLELPHAQEAYQASQVVLNDVVDVLKEGGEFDAVEVKGAVNRMTESIIRNPDALVLLSAMKERGGYFLTRAMNRSIYMIMFARFLGMEQADIERAGMVGLLQDIAMVQLPEAVVSKKGPLSPEEIKLVRSHVQTGKEILAATHGLPPDIATLAAMHHERHDGSGYPHALRGPDLGTIAACAGLVDTYGAMTSARPYADAMAPSNALGMLHKWRGRAFHPELVEEFIRCIGVFPVGSVVELNSGEVGIVISQNQAKRLQPRVMVVRDAAGHELRPQKLIDLARAPKFGAQETYRIRRTLEYGRSGVGLKDVLMV
jgi:HD-GYP domain-containing protein (c-di-GMP phosphodiesterase class II)